MDEEHITGMVERVEWMAPIHYEILNFFDSHDVWATPISLSKNLGYGRNYVSSECKTLLEAGLLEQEGQTYRLTDRGRDLLAGELDADEIADPRG